MKKKHTKGSAQKDNPSTLNEENETAAAPTPTILQQPHRGRKTHASRTPQWSQRIYREGDAGYWTQLPKNIPNCPAGLEYLATINQLVVCKKLEHVEIMTGVETENSFMVKGVTGKNIYFAQEKSRFCPKNCCDSIRPVDTQIFDQFGIEVIHFHRPLACDNCFCPCCLQVLKVFSPPNNLIGVIEQKWSLWIPIFAVKNGAGDTVLKIEGPRCPVSCFNDVDFRIMFGDEKEQIGVITKQCSVLKSDLFTDGDYFGITFPMDLDVIIKAVMLGACFLIDHMFFER